MKNRFFRIFFVLSLISFIVPKVGSETLNKEEQDALVQEVGITQQLGEKLPLDLEFTNDDGSAVTLGSLLTGNPVILTPIYYECPMLCNLLLNGLIDGLKQMKFSVGKEFDVITYSFDPGESYELAAEKKKNYLKMYGRPDVADSWHFLTGSEENVRKLSEAIGFQYEYDNKSDEYAHAASIQILTPDGVIANYFSDVIFQPRDLRLAIIEASHDKIATFFDQIMLLCYHYDPAAGKYNFVIFKVIRVFGIITALIMLWFIFGNLLSERKRK